MTESDERTPSSSTFDDIIEALGPWRKYHIINYSLIFFGAFICGVYAEAFVFIAGEINFRCQVPECESLAERNWTNWAFPFKDNLPDKCNRYAISSNTSSHICTLDWFNNTTILACDQFLYGLDGETSIVKDYHLGCQQWKRTLIGSVYKAGFLISISLSGIFSDRYGRKRAVAYSAFLKGIVGMSKSFASAYEMFAVLQFLESAIGGGMLNSCFILLMEIASPKNRLLVGCLHFGFISLGMVTMASLSWLILDWRKIVRIVYSPVIFLIFYMWLMDESARWLLAKNRHKDAIKIIRKAERINGVAIPNALIEELYQNRKTTKVVYENVENEQFIDSKGTTNQTKKMSIFRDVFRSPTILNRLIICAFLWISCTFTYHGISINSVRTTDSRHLSYILVSLTQIPAFVTAYLTMDRVGRRTTLVMSFVTCGISSISSVFIPKDIFAVALIPSICGKFAITLAFTTLNIYTSELFPTFMRQSLVGTCSTLGHVGSLVATQVQLMAYYMESLPSILFGVLTLASGLLAFTIPETSKIKLPDTIEEAENIRRT